jgi:hypothetical protein
MNALSNIMTAMTDRFGPMAPLLAVGLAGVLLILVALPIVMKKKRDRFRELTSWSALRISLNRRRRKSCPPPS